jgi:hypothetical protein
MLRATSSVTLLAALLAAPATAQVVGRHVFDIDAPRSAFTYSGSVTFAGITGPIVGNPATFNVSGASSADFGLVAGAITTGQFVTGHGTVVTLPTLNARVPNPIPFLPPLATIQVTGATVVFRSVDVVTGNAQVFPVQPNGSFSAGIAADLLSGTAVVTGLVNQTLPLAGITSTAQVVSGTFGYTTGGVRLQVAIQTSLPFADPTTGVSGVLNLSGTIDANDRALASDVPGISSATGGSQVLRLSAGTGFANATYLVLGTASGTTPGLQFGSVNLPLNFDAITDFGISSPNVFPYANSLGNLDARGFGTASFTLPVFQPALNLGLHHAFATISGGTVTSASNAVPLSITN